jgi:hypothetical protein
MKNAKKGTMPAPIVPAKKLHGDALTIECLVDRVKAAAGILAAMKGQYIAFQDEDQQDWCEWIILDDLERSAKELAEVAEAHARETFCEPASVAKAA